VDVKPFSLAQLCKYFLSLGTTGFGGPVALCAAMQRDLVDRLGWYSQEDFKKGMTLSQMAPGPMATQMAIYLGWSRSGALGAALIGFVFVLPSFLMVVALAAAYIQFGSLPWIERVFRGISPVVLAIVITGAWKLAKKNLGHDPWLWAIAAVNASVTAVTRSENIAYFLLTGSVFAMFHHYRSRMPSKLPAVAFLVTGLKGAAPLGTLRDILLFFTKSGAFVFGSGLAIVPFLHGGVVDQYHWLNERQFIDAVAVAMITPGPVVITVGFIGFLAAGLGGAVLAAFGVFFPCYLFTVVPAPHFERWVRVALIKNLVTGITAAAVGAIAGAAFVIGSNSVPTWQAGALAAASLAVLIWFKKVPEPILILLLGGLGALFL
jgi:chromate transporter